MSRVARLCLALGIFAYMVWQVRPAVLSAGTQEIAEIVPVSSVNIGSSLNLNYGYSLFANGITDNWSDTATSLSFFAFVFPAQAAVTQTMTFYIFSPKKAVVYKYTFSAAKYTYEGTWFSIRAPGKYSTPGIYHAAMYANGVQIGQIPVVISPPTQ